MLVLMLIVAALVCFLLAALCAPVGHVNLQPLGLAILTFALLLLPHIR